MSKTSKLCQAVYHSTRLDGTMVLILICGFSGSKANQCHIGFGIGLPQSKPIVRSESYFWYMAKNLWRHFLTCDFSKFYASQRKTYGIFGILRKFLASIMFFLCKNIVLKIGPYLTWPWPDLRQVMLDGVIGSMTVTINVCVQNDPENMCRMHVWDFCIGHLWPDLDLLKYALCTYAVS